MSLLREYISEELRASANNPRVHSRNYVSELMTLSNESYTHNDGLISRWVLLEHYFERPWILSEAATAHARLLIEITWDSVKNLAIAAGGKALDAAKWTVNAAKEMTGKAAEILKKIGGNIAEAFTFLIGKLPGGDIVLEFLSDVVSNLSEKIKEMGTFLKDKIEEWAKTAKKKLVDFLLNTIFRDPKYDDLKQDIYKALGVSEDEIEQATNEMRELGVTTITELNWVLEVKGLICEDGAGEKVTDKLKDKLHISDGEDALKVMGALENPEFGAEGHVDPENFLRGKAAAVIDAIWGVYAKLVKGDAVKYGTPLFQSDFFKPFESGFGLAASAFMAILSAGDLAWDKMVEMIKAIMKGFKVGADRTKKGRAARALFAGGQDNTNLVDMLKGIVQGSNIEVFVRAMSGDPQKIKDAVKRIAGAIASGIKAAIKKYGPELISNASEGEAGEELEGEASDQIEDALGDFTDELFATG